MKTSSTLQVSTSTGERGGRFRRAGFSLLEVMMAMLLFFLAVFAILEVVTMSLRGARLLQRPTVNTASVAAWFSATNRLTEGASSGDFKDMLGDGYENFTWEAQVTPITNGLIQVDFGIVERTTKGASASAMTVLYYQAGNTGLRR